MIIPRYWAEARRTHDDGRRRFTIRRFGWSDASPDEAQRHAGQRADAAMARIAAGERLPKFEPKRAYHGAEGTPIREEIVAEHGGVVITRNSYGALCLNVADVLIADVDRQEPIGGCLAVLAGVLSGGFLIAAPFAPALLTFALAVLAAAAGLRLGMHRRRVSRQQPRQRLDAFLAAHPGWKVRVYETPAGLRLIAAHRPFAANDAEVAEFFAAVGADPVYVRMCQRQDCFRARLTAKPWRVGIARHLTPRSVWPVAEDRLPERRAWIEHYEQVAAGYAACRLVVVLGEGGEDARAMAVIELHDRLCKAEGELPLA